MVRKGFTLIEMVVVLVIIGIVSTIATATFRSISSEAKNMEAGTNVDRVILAQRAWAAKDGGYSSDINASWREKVADLSFVNAASSGPSEISIRVVDGTLFLAAESKSGDCYAVKVLSPTEGGKQEKLELDVCDTSSIA